MQDKQRLEIASFLPLFDYMTSIMLQEPDRDLIDRASLEFSRLLQVSYPRPYLCPHCGVRLQEDLQSYAIPLDALASVPRAQRKVP